MRLPLIRGAHLHVKAIARYLKIWLHGTVSPAFEMKQRDMYTRPLCAGETSCLHTDAVETSPYSLHVVTEADATVPKEPLPTVSTVRYLGFSASLEKLQGRGEEQMQIL